jgi:Cdc6-like AAA superfamily ATPase
MSVTGGSASIGEINPFAPVAVANTMESAWATIVTVDTPPIDTATRIVDDYLAIQAPAAGEHDAAEHETADRAAANARGTVLAVVGDYGTGKTHLVIHLLRHVRDRAGNRVRSMYLEANSDNFHTVYKRFIEKLDPAEIRDRVNQFYAEIVADSLGDSELTTGIAESLRRGSSDPNLVVESLGLTDSTLLRDLRERLRTVTENTAFATVLMLLLRPGFETAAWAWLKGDEPNPVLVERGISSRINTDAAALEAMGVIALLHRTRDHRFLLAIDELDKVLSAARTPGADVLTAFKQLLQVFRAAGAMLVLSGLPDFLNVVTKETRDRIATVVQMQPLTVTETRMFIEASQEQVFRKRRLAPFTPETVEYLVQLSRGTARQVIRLLYNAFRHASEAATPVTIDIVDKIARNELYLPRTDQTVRDEVREVLVRNGWPFRASYQVGTSTLTLVDYWIEPTGAEAGYGVIVTGSVIGDEDVAKLRDQAHAITAARRGGQGSGTVLVVNGYLPADLSDRLAAAFGVRPVLYEPSSFASNLTATLGSITHLRVATETNALAAVSEKVERINRQQATIHGYLETLSRHFDELRSSSGRRLDVIAEQLRALSTARDLLPGEATGVADQDEEPPPLPREVDLMFAGAVEAVAELDRFDVLLRDAFGVGEHPTVRGTRVVIRSRLSDPDKTQAAGVAALLLKTIATFRESAEEWYRGQLARRGDPGTGPRTEDRDRLDFLCSTYDAISEYLPSFHMISLGELAASVEEERDPATRATRRARQAKVRDILENLSLNVRQALLRSVNPAT